MHLHPEEREPQTLTLRGLGLGLPPGSCVVCLGLCYGEWMIVYYPKQTIYSWVLPPPPPVTVYIRGPIKGYIYNHIVIIIQVLLSGGSTQLYT